MRIPKKMIVPGDCFVCRDGRRILTDAARHLRSHAGWPPIPGVVSVWIKIPRLPSRPLREGGGRGGSFEDPVMKKMKKETVSYSSSVRVFT